MDGVDHVLLTRFNLPSLGAESVVRALDGWLLDRAELFERWCLPSVRAQSNQDFSWVVYFDPESPDWLKERIVDSWAPSTFTPFFREEVLRDDLLADIRSVSGGSRKTLLTTNLDNDDGLAADFVDRVQRVAPRDRQSAIYLTNGLIISGPDLYLRRDRTNAFCSVAEPWAHAGTCWVDWHVSLGQNMPVIEAAGPPAWLQVVHGNNVSNRVRGTLTSPLPHREIFAGLLDDAAVPSGRRLLKERFAGVPLRSAKEASRAVAKSLALRLVGRRGLDRIKLRLARRRRTV
ncbi:MAG: hypothetical protein H7279_03855 [Microbacteriaceae bacterium]|nr:hypothetical protein [Microbacteriaceae bacterium]